MKMSGYYEFDFLGAAPTANEVESNSFNIRQRQLWAQVELDGGFSFVGGPDVEPDHAQPRGDRAAMRSGFR